MIGSGKLDQLLAEGKEYVFVSNSDNLGATLDLALLQYFAGEDAGFMMEVAERTEADKKGGHLAMKDGGLILERQRSARELMRKHSRTSPNISSSTPTILVQTEQRQSCHGSEQWRHAAAHD